MYEFNSIKLYFFSVLKIFFSHFKKIYFRTNFYNKKLITFIPERIFYNPSTYLASSLTTISGDFYKISNTSPSALWETNVKESLQFENLHSFLWLTKLKAGLSIILTTIQIYGKWT